MKKTGRVTRADVARTAGVAESVVSNVLSGKRKVGEKTKAKVLSAIEKLGYRPDMLARALASGRSYQLGVLVPNLYNAYFAMVIMGIEKAAVEKGYTVLIATTETRPGSEVVKAFIDNRVDACILLTGANDSLFGLLAESGTPYATCGFTAPPIGDSSQVPPYVTPDFADGARQSVDYLVSLGHRKIVLMPGDYDPQDQNGRYSGWSEALGSHGLEPVLTVMGDYKYDSGYSAFDQVRNSGATAVLVGNDYMAMGLLDAARARGIRVPEDLSIVGFDDIWQAKRLTPSLTTVDTCHEQLGALTATVVFDKLAGKGIVNTVLPVKLIPRCSTGPIPTIIG